MFYNQRFAKVSLFSTGIYSPKEYFLNGGGNPGLVKMSEINFIVSLL